MLGDVVYKCCLNRILKYKLHPPPTPWTHHISTPSHLSPLPASTAPLHPYHHPVSGVSKILGLSSPLFMLEKVSGWLRISCQSGV